MQANIPEKIMRLNSTKLYQQISNEIIAEGGTISFARFMELALYTPELGYYMTQYTDKFGKSGDFITAPEISPLFAKCIAQQFAVILDKLPKNSAICEFGAGTGKFAQEVLLALPAYHCSLQKYYIIETSPTLRTRQQQLFAEHNPQLLSKITWLDSLPPNFCGIIFANEFLDALPVHCIYINQDIIYEKSVQLIDGNFSWKLTEPKFPELRQYAQNLSKKYQLSTGYSTELSLIIPKWLETMSSSLSQGVILFFDYGYHQAEYYHPDRSSGSLRCYFQHRIHDNPFFAPGLQDITANVDFTALTNHALHNNLDLIGYTTQTAFLLNSNISELITQEQQQCSDAVTTYQRNQALKTLLLPTEMGELIKAIAFGKNWNHSLPAFAQFDLSHLLQD